MINRLYNERTLQWGLLAQGQWKVFAKKSFFTRNGTAINTLLQHASKQFVLLKRYHFLPHSTFHNQPNKQS